MTKRHNYITVATASNLLAQKNKTELVNGFCSFLNFLPDAVMKFRDYGEDMAKCILRKSGSP